MIAKKTCNLIEKLKSVIPRRTQNVKVPRTIRCKSFTCFQWSTSQGQCLDANFVQHFISYKNPKGNLSRSMIQRTTDPEHLLIAPFTHPAPVTPPHTELISYLPYLPFLVPTPSSLSPSSLSRPLPISKFLLASLALSNSLFTPSNLSRSKIKPFRNWFSASSSWIRASSFSSTSRFSSDLRSSEASRRFFLARKRALAAVLRMRFTGRGVSGLW